MASSNPFKHKLIVGRELYNNSSKPERSVVSNIKTLDLSYSEDQKKLEELKKDSYASLKSQKPDSVKTGIDQAQNVKFIELNKNIQSKNRYAHILKLNIVESDYREDSSIWYAYYSDDKKFEWSFDPKAIPSKKNTDISDAERRARIDLSKFIRLPISYTSSSDSLSVRGVSPHATAASYWQPFYTSVRTAQALDRIKPSSISGLRSAEKRAMSKANYDIDQIRKDNSDYDDITDKKLKDNADKVNTILKKAIESRRGITTRNIQSLIKKSRALTSGSNFMRGSMPHHKTQYLSDLIQPFLARIDDSNYKPDPRSIYPLMIVDDVTPRNMMMKYGIQAENSIRVDFMEVVHPVAVITGNTTGAQDMILSYLKANNYKELVDSAMITYGATSSEQLADSSIYHVGSDGMTRRLMISSKSGGQGANLVNLQVAYAEIRSNPEANKRFKEMLKKVNSNTIYKTAWAIIRSFIVSPNSTMTAMNILLNTAELSRSDIEFINTLITTHDLNQEKDIENDPFSDEGDDIVTEAKEIRKISDEIKSKFSAKLKAIYNNYPKEQDDITRLVMGVNKDVMDQYNEPEIKQAFSEIVSWLFNHSATVQVDTHSTLSNDVLTINNLTTTWPSTRTESVNLFMDQSGRYVKYKLEINGYSFESKGAELEDRKDIESKQEEAYKREMASRVTTSDWVKPDAIDMNDDSSRLTTAKAYNDAKFSNRISRDIKLNQVTMWQWAGAPYTLEKIKSKGMSDENINSILNARNKLIVSIETGRELRESIYESISRLKEDDEESESRKVAQARNSAKQALMNLKNTNWQVYQTLVQEIQRIEQEKKDAEKYKDRSSGFIKVLQFLSGYNVTTKNQLVAFIKNLVSGKQSNTEKFIANFNNLMSDSSVRALISDAERLNLSEADNISDYEEKAEKFIIAIYWAIKLYQFNLEKNSEQASIAYQNLLSTMSDISPAFTLPKRAGKLAQKQEVPQTPKQIAIQLISKFLSDNGVKATLNSAFVIATQIINGTLPNIQKIVSDFKVLMNNDVVKSIIKITTVDQIKHPKAVLNEVNLTENDIETAITVIYWALVLARYKEIGYDKNNKQYNEVIQKLQAFASKASSAVNREFLKSIKQNLKESRKSILKTLLTYH